MRWVQRLTGWKRRWRSCALMRSVTVAGLGTADSQSNGPHAQMQRSKECAVETFAVCAGSSMINALGAEVDRLEAEVAQLCPGIRHIDLVSLRVSSARLQ